MSAEIIAIIGAAIAVISVNLTSMGRLESRLDAKIDAFTATIGAATRENQKRISGD